MAGREREEFILRGQVRDAIRENTDGFIYSPSTMAYIGKALVRPYSTQGPYIAYLEFEEISDNHPTLESAVDAIARRRAVAQESA